VLVEGQTGFGVLDSQHGVVELVLGGVGHFGGYDWGG
jgi:hypothetical protein